MKFIFEVKIKPGCSVEQYVEAWKKWSELIQNNHGARGTRLLRKIGEADVLLAIADWDSKEARDLAMTKLRESDPETQKIWQAHNELGEITKIGEYDETKWQVLPVNQET